VSTRALADRIDALLPQTQCTRCGYPDCRGYADALAQGAADINQCPPGGEATLQALNELLGRDIRPIDPSRGTMPAQPEVALIDEADCIGCFKCVQACPVDAIVGAPKLMHTVIAAECSGCELCLPVCPTDCISMTARVPALPAPAELAPHWRQRHRARDERLTHERRSREDARRARRGSALKDRAAAFDIDAALARARGKHGPDKPNP
jgi:electron transport complex protein RnfB